MVNYAHSLVNSAAEMDAEDFMQDVLVSILKSPIRPYPWKIWKTKGVLNRAFTAEFPLRPPRLCGERPDS
jgi:DNA-directed RNA polymerase specialized sigma24 family protein